MKTFIKKFWRCFENTETEKRVKIIEENIEAILIILEDHRDAIVLLQSDLIRVDTSVERELH